MTARRIKEAKRARRAPWQAAPSNAALPAPARAWTFEPDAPDTIAAQIEELARGRDLADVVALHALHSVLRRLERLGAGGLALRGSMLLRAWVDASARESHVARQPKDLDFVCTRPMPPREVERILLDAVALASDDGVVFDATAVHRSETWPYSDTQGLRFQLPWEMGRWRGAAQVDVALEEPLPIPVPTLQATLPGLLVGLDANVEACTPEVSLAWKLRWVVDDDVPQAKDVWDAICLLRYVGLADDELQLALELVPTRGGLSVSARLDEVNEPLWSHWRELSAALANLGALDVPRDANDARMMLEELLRERTRFMSTSV